MFLNNKKLIFLLSASFMFIGAHTAFALVEANFAGKQIFVEGAAGYIRYLFIFGLGLVGFLALAAMTFGGIKYILAAGNASKVEDAKDQITQALIGLGLALLSYLILRTINPDLVNLKNPKLNLINIQVAPLAPIGQDVAGRIANLGDPESAVVIGEPGQQPRPDLVQQCLQNRPNMLVQCQVTTAGTGQPICLCEEPHFQ